MHTAQNLPQPGPGVVTETVPVQSVLCRLPRGAGEAAHAHTIAGLYLVPTVGADGEPHRTRATKEFTNHPGSFTDGVGHVNIVAPTGFEPVFSDLKGRGLRPLADDARVPHAKTAFRGHRFADNATVISGRHFDLRTGEVLQLTCRAESLNRESDAGHGLTKTEFCH